VILVWPDVEGSEGGGGCAFRCWNGEVSDCTSTNPFEDGVGKLVSCLLALVSSSSSLYVPRRISSWGESAVGISPAATRRTVRKCNTPELSNETHGSFRPNPGARHYADAFGLATDHPVRRSARPGRPGLCRESRVVTSSRGALGVIASARLGARARRGKREDRGRPS
jgi:hypothetical protein